MKSVSADQIKTESCGSTADSVIQRVTDLVPALRQRGAEAEELRRLTDATIADLEGAGIFATLRPESVGGLGLDLQSFAQITRILSRGDASAGWIGSFYMAHAWLLSKLGKDAQDAIFGGRSHALAAATVSQAGRAEPVEGGYSINGRWRFASGIMHAEWVVLMALTNDGPIQCVVPVSAMTIHDVWHVPGMKATGSNDAEAQDLFVPTHMIASFADLIGWDSSGARLYDYPLLRCPVQLPLSLIHPAVALGVADAAIELFSAEIERRVRIPAGTKLIDEAGIHDMYAQAIDERRCAEMRLSDAIDIITAGLDNGPQGLSETEMAEANLAITSAGDRAFRVIDLIIRNSGASIHRSGHPLDRICRDTQVMRNHTVVDARYHLPAIGRVLLMGGNAGTGLRPLKIAV